MWVVRGSTTDGSTLTYRAFDKGTTRFEPKGDDSHWLSSAQKLRDHANSLSKESEFSTTRFDTAKGRRHAIELIVDVPKGVKKLEISFHRDDLFDQTLLELDLETASGDWRVYSLIEWFFIGADGDKAVRGGDARASQSNGAFSCEVLSPPESGVLLCRFVTVAVGRQNVVRQFGSPASKLHGDHVVVELKPFEPIGREEKSGEVHHTVLVCEPWRPFADGVEFVAAQLSAINSVRRLTVIAYHLCGTLALRAIQQLRQQDRGQCEIRLITVGTPGPRDSVEREVATEHVLAAEARAVLRSMLVDAESNWDDVWAVQSVGALWGSHVDPRTADFPIPHTAIRSTNRSAFGVMTTEVGAIGCPSWNNFFRSESGDGISSAALLEKLPADHIIVVSTPYEKAVAPFLWLIAEAMALSAGVVDATASVGI